MLLNKCPSNPVTTFDVQMMAASIHNNNGIWQFGFDFKANSFLPANTVITIDITGLPNGVIFSANTIAGGNYLANTNVNTIIFLVPIPAQTSFTVSGLLLGQMNVGGTATISLSGDNIINNNSINAIY